MKIGSKLPAAVVAAVLTFCFASAVLSFDKKSREEDKLRMVSGEVLDPQENPISGAVVQLKNSKTLQVQLLSIAQEKGAYQFHGLDPNTDYLLKADYHGASSAWKTLSSFDSRKQPVINLKIEIKK